MNTDYRQQELAKLRSYIEDIDKETAMLLQNLQWDSKFLMTSTAMVSCRYEANHRMPPSSKEAHEKQCYLALYGYSKDDVLLPDPVDPEADTVVKFSKQDIMKIINAAASSDPSFKRIESGPEPLSCARLQLAYSADERRVIHDATVAAAPALSDLTDDLSVPGVQARRNSRPKHWVEILAEQRDMKRRRAKYRGAAHTANYSHTLRDLIKTQMELYAEARGMFIKTEYGSKSYISVNSRSSETQASEESTTSSRIVIKQERITPDDENDENGTRIDERTRESRRRRDSRRDEKDPPKRRRDHRDAPHSNTHKDRSPIRDKYTSKERRRYHDFHSKRDHKYDRRDVHYRDRLDCRKDHSNGGKSSSHRYEGSQDRHSKYVRYYDSYTDKCAGSSREHSKHDRRFRDSSKGQSDSYISIKREEHTNDSESQLELQQECYDVQIKQEKEDDEY